MDYLYYTIWPWIKVKSTYYWWVIKYRGKKNIPPELIFLQMARSMARMNENIQLAMRVLPDDASREEKEQLVELLSQSNLLEDEVGRIKIEK